MKKLANYILKTTFIVSTATTIALMAYVNHEKESYMNSLHIKGYISDYKKEEILKSAPREIKEKIDYGEKRILEGLVIFLASGLSLYCTDKKSF